MAMDKYNFLSEPLVSIEKITAPATCLLLSLLIGYIPWITSRDAHTSSQNKFSKLILFMFTDCHSSVPFSIQNLFQQMTMQSLIIFTRIYNRQTLNTVGAKIYYDMTYLGWLSHPVLPREDQSSNQIVFADLCCDTVLKQRKN